MPDADIQTYRKALVKKLLATEAKLGTEQKVLATDEQTEKVDEDDESIAMALRKARQATRRDIVASKASIHGSRKPSQAKMQQVVMTSYLFDH